MYENTLNKRIVAKKYHIVRVIGIGNEVIIRDIETQTISNYLSREFSSQDGLPCAIDFITTSWYTEILNEDK